MFNWGQFWFYSLLDDFQLLSCAFLYEEFFPFV